MLRKPRVLRRFGLNLVLYEGAEGWGLTRRTLLKLHVICRFPAPNPRVSDASEPGFVNLRATEQFTAQRAKSLCLGTSEPDLVKLRATEQFAAQRPKSSCLGTSEPDLVNLRATDQFAAQRPKSSCFGASEPDSVNLRATEQFAAQGSEAQFLLFGYI